MEVTATQLIALLRAGTAPHKVRVAIARGALPLPAPALLESLDLLADDPDPAVQSDARDSCARLPEALVRGVVSSPASAPDLLDRLARRFRDNATVLQDIADNGAAADATIAFIAALPHPAPLAAIGRNRGRLERSPETMVALLANPATPTAIVQLWQEKSGCGTDEPFTSASGAEASAEDAPAFAPILVEEDEKDAAGPVRPPAAEPDEALSAKQLSIFAMLKKMSMGQKVALAVKGNREVRNLLIRENNRMLSLKVLENPRLGETDIEAYAKSTNLSDDVLRAIANQKEWCKKYPIVKALVFNPRAPLGVTLDLVKRLSPKDIDFLSKNRNVPETLRTTARRMMALKRESNR